MANVVCLVGRLTKDPEEKQAGETTVTRFTVAVDRQFKREGEPTADFINCVAFGKTAEFVGKYFTKGKSIGLSGRIQTGSYKNKDGNTVYTTDVVAEKAEFVGSKDNSSSGFKPEDESQVPTGFTNDFSEIPF